MDTIIDRRGTNAYKLELCKSVFGTEDLLPLWVADMDFATPEPVLAAIRQRLEHPIMGYTLVGEEFYKDIKDWLKSQHGWEVKAEWIHFLPGIVPGIAFAVQEFTAEGDDVIVQTPVYPHFFETPLQNKRNVLYNKLLLRNGVYEMDFDGLEKLISDKTKLFVLCNPHNPGGRVWDKATLARLAEICAAKGIIVVSDEIHSDMVHSPHKHIPFASVSQAAAQCSITFAAPTKTFNMPGLSSSFFVIPNKQLRERFQNFMYRLDLGYTVNPLTMAATHAAFTACNEWREQMMATLASHIDMVIEELSSTRIKVMRPEASFLVWMDFSAYGLTDEELFRKMNTEAKVGLNPGPSFGAGGEQHLRLNIATPAEVLAEALRRIKSVFD